MKNKLVTAALLGTTLLLVACSGSKAINPLTLLGGKSFNVESIMGQTLDAASSMKGLPSFNFGTDGKVSGTTGCNNFSGMLKTDGGKFSIDPGAMTRMACPGDTEGKFIDAIKQVNGVKAVGDKIKLLNGATELMSLVPKL